MTKLSSLTVTLFFVSAFLTKSLAQNLTQPSDNPLEQFAFYMGDWGLPKDDTGVMRNPEMKDYLVISFSWGTSKKVIWSKTGLLSSDNPAASSEGMITYNPNTNKIVWLEYEIDNEILFEGEYIVMEGNKVQRIYTVYYPEGYESIPNPQAEGWTRLYRETFTPISKNSIHWLTETFIDNKWILNRPGATDVRAERR